ncbi:MAG TPA: hypothetical protein VIB48_04590 [Acidimicrobiia bacterium]|jgi:hypothetical protein
MKGNDDTARDGGWGAMLDGVDGANAGAGADPPRRAGWDLVGALVDRSSGGDAAGQRYARVVAQIGAFVPGELREAAETLLHVAGGASSWAGAVIDAAPSAPPLVSPHDVPSAPVPAEPEREAGPEPTPSRVTEAAPAPTPGRAPVPADAFPEDPTFEAAIAASPPAEHPSEVTT